MSRTRINNIYKKDVFSLFFLFAILFCWIINFYFLLTLRASISIRIIQILFQAWLYTGIFICAHDGLHGTLIRSAPSINKALSFFLIQIYAFLPYKKLFRYHHEHHKNPETKADPDYYTTNPHMILWFKNFIQNYVSFFQILLMAVLYNMFRMSGYSDQTIWMSWILPLLLSTIQLFYFGTYLPHRPSHRFHTFFHKNRKPPPLLGHLTTTSSPHLRCSQRSHLFSLLCCFHFDYHFEHHHFPNRCWWELPHVHSTLHKKNLNQMVS